MISASFSLYLMTKSHFLAPKIRGSFGLMVLAPHRLVITNGVWFLMNGLFIQVFSGGDEDDGLEGGNLGDDVREGELKPLVEGDVTIAVAVHGFEGFGTFVGRGVGCWESQPLLVPGGHLDHLPELVVGDHPVPVGVSGLEALPVEPVELLVGVGGGVLRLLHELHEIVLLHLVGGLGQRSHLRLVLVHGVGQPLVERDGSVLRFRRFF